MRRSIAFVVIPAVFSTVTAAQAEVTISSAATSNMSCLGGVCSPTAKNAILNVTDLENLLATGNVEVTTTGSGVQAGDIDIDAALAWSSTTTLALDAWVDCREAADFGRRIERRDPDHE
jgi:hypothetical protein